MEQLELATPTMFDKVPTADEQVMLAMNELGKRFRFCPDIHSPSFLGVGGYASVFRGTLADAEVAIKVFQKTMANTPFLHEVSAWNRLRAIPHHPCFPQVHEVGWSEGGVLGFVVMSYIPDQTYLEEMSGRKPVLSRRNRLAVLAHVLSGLSHLATHGLIHRDIKPDNITVGVQPKILDLGLLVKAGQRRDPSDRHAFGGTPRYMAPECFNLNLTLTPAVDVFSLGLLMAESFGARFLTLDSKQLREMRALGCTGLAEADYDSRFKNSMIAHAFKLTLGQMLHNDPSKRMTASQACREISDIVAAIDETESE